MGASSDQLRATILVEFGALSEEQQSAIDLHPLRAVGTDLPSASSTDTVIIEFWISAGDTVESVYDDIRGWAIGKRLPIRGLATV